MRRASVPGIASGAELFEDALRDLKMALGDRTRAGLRDEPPEREMAQRGLIAFTKQIEQRGALSKIVVRVGSAAGLRMKAAAKP